MTGGARHCGKLAPVGAGGLLLSIQQARLFHLCVNPHVIKLPATVKAPWCKALRQGGSP